MFLGAYARNENQPERRQLCLFIHEIKYVLGTEAAPPPPYNLAKMDVGNGAA